jgi:hypothetical protein
MVGAEDERHGIDKVDAAGGGVPGTG